MQDYTEFELLSIRMERALENNPDGEIYLNKGNYQTILKALHAYIKLDRLTTMYKQEGHKPARTITMEELREFIEEKDDEKTD